MIWSLNIKWLYLIIIKNNIFYNILFDYIFLINTNSKNISTPITNIPKRLFLFSHLIILIIIIILIRLLIYSLIHLRIIVSLVLRRLLLHLYLIRVIIWDWFISIWIIGKLLWIIGSLVWIIGNLLWVVSILLLLLWNLLLLLLPIHTFSYIATLLYKFTIFLLFVIFIFTFSILLPNTTQSTTISTR